MKIAYALDCSVTDVPDIIEKVRVNDIVIPETSPDGSIIWKSKNYHRHVVCENGIDEDVYFYPFPELKEDEIPNGMEFVLSYNGKLYPLNEIQKECANHTMRCLKTDIKVEKKKKSIGDVDVQLLIKKVGLISEPINDELPVYQLDGKLGLNKIHQNYRLVLTNLKKVATGTCEYAFNKIKNSHSIAINDDLLSKGITIDKIASLSVSCVPVSLLKNRIVDTNIYATDSVNGSLFGTNKEGLGYSLILDNNYLTPDNPVNLSVKLDENAKADISINQELKLSSPDKNWLYQKDTKTTSDNPKLKVKVSNFE